MCIIISFGILLHLCPSKQTLISVLKNSENEWFLIETSSTVEAPAGSVATQHSKITLLFSSTFNQGGYYAYLIICIS